MVVQSITDHSMFPLSKQLERASSDISKRAQTDTPLLGVFIT